MVEIYFHLPLLIVIISLVYSGTRYDAWSAIIVEAGRWGFRHAVFVAGIALVLFILSNLIPSAAAFFRMARVEA